MSLTWDGADSGLCCTLNDTQCICAATCAGCQCMCKGCDCAKRRMKAWVLGERIERV